VKPIVAVAVVIITLALACYTVGTAMQQRSRRITGRTLAWLTAGVLFDITATGCMIVAAGSWVPKLHGALGYSALLGMLIEVVAAWRHRGAHGDHPITDRMALYSRLAYAWWVVAFLSGGALIARERMARKAVAALLGMDDLA